MNTPTLLSHFETCNRKGAWSREWERETLDSAQILEAAIAAGVMERERQDLGEVAGEEIMSLAASRGLETKSHQVYDSAVHHAALADLLTTAVRKPSEAPWTRPEPLTSGWRPAAFLDPSGTRLRRVVLATSWSDERHYAEIRSWYALGEVAAYKLPMQQVVLILGVQRDGRRHSPWTKGLLHPQNRKLRFRKAGGGPFKETWERIWREDHGEIDRMTWLQGMLDDDVLRDVCFKIDIPVPGDIEVQRLTDMAARKLEQLVRMKELPDQQLSTCDWPVPCVFQRECHGGGSPTEGRFVHLSQKRAMPSQRQQHVKDQDQHEDDDHDDVDNLLHLSRQRQQANNPPDEHAD